LMPSAILLETSFQTHIERLRHTLAQRQVKAKRAFLDLKIRLSLPSVTAGARRYIK
jgi:hypothetical protein